MSSGILSLMNQRASFADALGDIRRELLHLDDIDRQGRSIHCDADDLKEFGRSIQAFDRDVHVGNLAEAISIEQGPPLVDPARIHLRDDLRDDSPHIATGSRVALVESRTASSFPIREERAHLVEIDSEVFAHGR